MVKDLTSIPVETNHQPSFIGLWSIQNSEICDKVISFFQNNEMSHSDVGFYDYADNSVKYDKAIVNGKQMQVKLEDLQTDDYDPIKNYFLMLEKCFLSYCESWPTIQTDRIGISRNASIVKYLKSEKEFNEYNYHRKSSENVMDLFSFKTYLNSLENEKGNTEFYYQGTSINHFKGLTIIWPTDWTHASRFVPPDDDSISFTINGTLGYTHIRDKKIGLEFDELRD